MLTSRVEAQALKPAALLLEFAGCQQLLYLVVINVVGGLT